MSDYDWTTAMRVRLETERDALRARVAELEDDFAKRQASHCCPTWNDQMEDCDCDERMGGHIARWQEAEAEVAEVARVMNGDHSTPMRAFAYEVSAVVKSHATLLKQRDEALDRAERAEAQVATLRELAETFHGCEGGRRERDCPVCIALAATEPKGGKL